MKLFTLTMLTLLITFSCEPKAKGENSSIVIGDTITTTSGLKYVYHKVGKGPKIEQGTEVFAYNKLMIGDKVIWSTDNEKDSVFSFVQNGTGLIKGALELYPLLREGDEVAAVMHGDIAYGPQGRGMIPPNATLLFDPIIIKKVGPKKAFLSDTLTALVSTGDVQGAIAFYDSVVDTDLKNSYHTNPYSLQSSIRSMMEKNMYAELETFCAHIETKVEGDDKDMFRWYKMIGAENQGKIKEAIEYLQPFLDKQPVNQNITQKLEMLKAKLSK